MMHRYEKHRMAVGCRKHHKAHQQTLREPLQMAFPTVISDYDAKYSLCKRLSKRPILRLDDPEAYQYEYCRLASFAQWPEGTDIHFLEVAKYGLYFIGPGPRLKCFSCNTTFRVSSNDPVEVHNQRMPSCPFLQHKDTLNKPISSDSEDESDSIEADVNIDNTDSDIVGDINRHSGPPNFPVEKSPSLPLISQERECVLENQTAHSLPYSKNQQGSNRMEHGLTTSAAEMFQEEKRYATFESFPASDKVNPVQLAELGFFYTGIEDKTQCAFCNGILKKWEQGDDIEAEHKKFFRSCPFLRGVEQRNVRRQTAATASAPAEDLLLRRTEASATTQMTCRPLNFTASHVPNDYEARLATFAPAKGWDSTNVSPEQLAEAGFIFTGNDDNVRCHYCDGGLRNWEPNDDPWMEHARWFPKCGFVLAKKGKSFVEKVMEKIMVVPRKTAGPEVKEEYPPDYALNVEYRKQALDMGFTDRQIKRAVEQNEETHGHTFLNMHSLMESLLMLIEDQAPSQRGRSHHGRHTDEPVSEKPLNSPQSLPEEEKAATKSKKSKKKKKKDKQNSLDPSPAQGAEATTLYVPEDDDESRSLLEENRQLKEQRMCKLCMDAEVNIVFLPCGHLVACSNCASAVRSCPICRALIRGSLRTYLS